MTKLNKILLMITASGLIIMSFSIIYYILPRSHTVDADLGGAAFLIIGTPIVAVGVISLCLSLLSNRVKDHPQPEFSFWRLLKFLLLGAIVLYLILFLVGTLFT